MDAVGYYTDHFKPINEAISIICRKYEMSRDEEKDFAQHVHLQLIENDYKILRAFKGNSCLKTYLHTVISRIFIDQVRVKWHPSAEARVHSGTFWGQISFVDKWPTFHDCISGSSPALSYTSFNRYVLP